MQVGRNGWDVHAPTSPVASYVSQSFRASKTVRVEFCLKASRGANTELVRLQPSGISLVLRRGHIELEVAQRDKRSRASRPSAVTGGPNLVALTVDASPGRVELDVAGREQGWSVGKAPVSSVVQIGSVARRPRGQ